jgi:uncharacterized protein YcbK (DUF882 family)
MKDLHYYESASASHALTRRSFLKWSLAAATVFSGPVSASALSLPSPSSERVLSLYNVHTGERFHDVYWASGQYVPEALTDINRILRDYRTDEVISVDERLLDLLYTIRKQFHKELPFQVISGYRSPETNDYLRRNGRHVARNSMHMKGKAIDVSLPQVPLPKLRTAAMKLKKGGVGYYPASNFVHIDTGRVRHW